MIICAGIGATDHHNCCITLKETIVADRWFEKVAIFREPVLEAYNMRYHLGRFMGRGSDILLVSGCVGSCPKMEIAGNHRRGGWLTASIRRLEWDSEDRGRGCDVCFRVYCYILLTCQVWKEVATG
jgi:hypothetical protein